MRKPFYLLVFVLALSLAYATSQTGSTSTNSQTSTQSQYPTQTQSGSSSATSSTDVQSQIQNAFKNEPTLSNDNITVTVTDNEVELTGTVASDKEKHTAKKIAQSYASGRKVKEHLTVGSGSTGSNTTTPPPENTAGSIAGNASAQATSSVAETAQMPGTTPGDAFPSRQSSGSMTQTPPTATSQQPETQTAQSGNTATQASTSGDLQIQIQTALQKEPTLSGDSVNVSVSDDSIELNGTVASSKEKQTAKRIAQSYAGNRKVVDHLTVSGRGSDNMTNPPSSTIPPPDTSKPPSGMKPPGK
jgi:osmotically-inducible protein OsmY